MLVCFFFAELILKLWLVQESRNRRLHCQGIWLLWGSSCLACDICSNAKCTDTVVCMAIRQSDFIVFDRCHKQNHSEKRSFTGRCSQQVFAICRIRSLGAICYRSWKLNALDEIWTALKATTEATASATSATRATRAA